MKLVTIGIMSFPLIKKLIMETRKIVIIDSATNKQVVVNTDASNFGELKRAAKAAGISYEGKDWLEGITKTSPMADDSLLPVNVSYVPKSGPNAGTPVITNNLVYMLTNTNKKIRSGMDRKAIYAEIKKLGLAEEVKKKFGKNYTVVGSADLLSVITKAKNKTSKTASTSDVENLAAIRKEMEKASKNNYEEKYAVVVKALAKFLTSIPKDILNEAAEVAKTLTPETVVEEIDFSSMDLKEMFRK